MIDDDFDGPVPVPMPKPEEYYRLVAVVKEIQETSTKVSATLGDALSRAVVDGERLDVIFRSIGQTMSRWALNRAMKGLEGLLSVGLTKIGGSFAADLIGLNIDPGKIAPVPFAKGGVVAAPTYFPLPGSASGTGLMGEAGAEAILPLSRDARGRLGVSALGDAPGGAPSIVFNVETRDAESFLRSEAQVATMVARAAGRGRRGL